VLEGGVLCNDSHLNEEGGVYTPNGAPTEVALITAGLKAGVTAEELKGTKPRLGSVPFESEHKFMATVNSIGGRRVLFVKGAPDRIMPMCAGQLSGDSAEELETAGGAGAKLAPLDTAFWTKAQEDLSSEGLRVLALCKCAGPEGFVGFRLGTEARLPCGGRSIQRPASPMAFEATLASSACDVHQAARLQPRLTAQPCAPAAPLPPPRPARRAGAS
jgi:hypothetical protein